MTKTDSEIDTAVEMYVNGECVDEICLRLNWSRQTLIKYLKQRRISIPHKRGRPSSDVSRENRERVASAYMNGESPISISRTVGLHRRTVWRILKREGIQRTPNRSPAGMAKCLRCKKIVTHAGFRFAEDTRGASARSGNCIECEKIMEEARLKRAESQPENRDRDLMSNYGINSDAYEKMLSEQDGRCSICRDTPISMKYLVVDHDHATGIVRGLLCNNCNWGLGNFRDNPTFLANAIEYLEKNQHNSGVSIYAMRESKEKYLKKLNS